MVRVIATFVIKPEALAEVIAKAKELVEKTRLEEGCIAYDLLQSQKDTGKLVVVEVWESPEVLKAHEGSEHFTAIVPFIVERSAQPPVIELFDQLV